MMRWRAGPASSSSFQRSGTQIRLRPATSWNATSTVITSST